MYTGLLPALAPLLMHAMWQWMDSGPQFSQGKMKLPTLTYSWESSSSSVKKFQHSWPKTFTLYLVLKQTSGDIHTYIHNFLNSFYIYTEYLYILTNPLQGLNPHHVAKMLSAEDRNMKLRISDPWGVRFEDKAPWSHVLLTIREANTRK